MEDPGPLSTFEGFGDNALNFILRCYLPSMENRITTISELHMTIDKLFREAGITIAFPQRDVHLDASSPVDVRVVSEESTTQAPEVQTKSVPEVQTGSEQEVQTDSEPEESS